MITKLFVKNIEVFAHHGLFPEENKLGQNFIFEVECDVKYKTALFNDNINDSVSYADITQTIVEVTTQSTFNLLERLAGEILKNLFNKFPEITYIKLKINKPAAPIKYHFEECGVMIEAGCVEFLNL
ncbi:dihydroneopterin aldolase [Gemella cuniculi]|uniref:dihydroneopterin aldolase n=1 Tax=Gemella cuniculi TaxID=150240 RepID=UPI0004192D24|nr:dihydroneopterin aldolase [Gemella cuniculi]